MTTYEMGYKATHEWLSRGCEGPCPAPPDDMHKLAVMEWLRGHDSATAAWKAEEKDDADWKPIEDFIVFLVKISLLMGLLALARWSHNGYIEVLTGLLGLYLVWRMK